MSTYIHIPVYTHIYRYMYICIHMYIYTYTQVQYVSDDLPHGLRDHGIQLYHTKLASSLPKTSEDAAAYLALST